MLPLTTTIGSILNSLGTNITIIIKTRINNLKQEFDTVETNIRNDLTTSAETIDTADKNILDTLNQGNQ